MTSETTSARDRAVTDEIVAAFGRMMDAAETVRELADARYDAILQRIDEVDDAEKTRIYQDLRAVGVYGDMAREVLRYDE